MSLPTMTAPSAWRRVMMATKQTEAVKQLTYLAGSLKAPRILEAVGRLAEQARAAG
ncbi:hypothetical protein ACIPV2_01540 [Microbacterium sp. NPDC089987]|uniref:hypothetical protein n=1 Tax=Microbacterium sp. NPDC089987 TaxID=3364202 RepID=UPI00381EFBFF